MKKEPSSRSDSCAFSTPELDAMSTDDPDYNTTVEKLQRAEADCNG